MTATDHIRTLRRLARLNKIARAKADGMPTRLSAAAKAAHADGMPISAIALALGCTRYYAHVLVHGRKPRRIFKRVFQSCPLSPTNPVS